MVKYRDVPKRQRMFPLSTWMLVHMGEPVPSMWTNKGTRNGTHRVPTAWLAVHCALPHLLIQGQGISSKWEMSPLNR